jgi:hypothetical protein
LAHRPHRPGLGPSPGAGALPCAHLYFLLRRRAGSRRIRAQQRHRRNIRPASRKSFPNTIMGGLQSSADWLLRVQLFEPRPRQYFWRTVARSILLAALAVCLAFPFRASHSPPIHSAHSLPQLRGPLTLRHGPRPWRRPIPGAAADRGPEWLPPRKGPVMALAIPPSPPPAGDHPLLP